jgi:hypothetical protein
MSVGVKCIMYLFCISRFVPCNSSDVCVCVEFYSRYTHSISVLWRHEGYSSNGWRGASGASAAGRRDKGATNGRFYIKIYFLLSSNFKLFKQKKIRQKTAVVFKDRNFCQGWP